MTQIFSITATFGSILLLSACGGSGGSDDPITPVSSNGLAFATDTTTVNDLENQTANVRLVRFITDEETGETQIEISSETFRVDDISAENYTASVDGDTITFVDAAGQRANGVDIFSRDGTDGDFARVVSFFSYVFRNPSVDTGENTEGFIVAGFETDPTTIDTLSGQVVYTGQFRGFGTLIETGSTPGLTNEVFVDGQTVIMADFNDGNVSGTADINVGVPIELRVALEFDDTALQGSSFNTALTATDCGTGFTCTANQSDLFGTLFGPSADELGATVAIDVTATATDGSGDQIRFVGAGASLAPGVAQ